MTDLDAVDTETLAAACRTAAVSSAHADLLNAVAARMLAMLSWIDGAKVDMAALEEAAAKATTWHMEALDDLATCVAERDDWRRRYEALRDGVTGLCDDPHAHYSDGRRWVATHVLRVVVARVEGAES